MKYVRSGSFIMIGPPGFTVFSQQTALQVPNFNSKGKWILTFGLSILYSTLDQTFQTPDLANVSFDALETFS